MVNECMNNAKCNCKNAIITKHRTDRGVRFTNTTRRHVVSSSCFIYYLALFLLTSCKIFPSAVGFSLHNGSRLSSRPQVCPRSSSLFIINRRDVPSSTTTLQSSQQTDYSNSDTAISYENDDHESNSDKSTSHNFHINRKLASLAEQASQQRNVTAAGEALVLLRMLSRPDTVAYNSVLKALAKISPAKIRGLGTASDVAQDLLEEMENLYTNQVEENRIWYQRLSDGLLTDGELKNGAPEVIVKPNVRSYSTVMDALARKADVESAEKTEKILRTLERRYRETQDAALQPNLITYNTLLSAYARCGSLRCLELLKSMPLSPDVISYNAVLHALARSGHDSAGERAEMLLRAMNDVQPNARSYTTCIDAYAQSGNPVKAHALLQELVDRYLATKDVNLHPNAISYSTVIHAYATSRLHNKAQKAYEVLQSMIRDGISPNLVTFNNLLNACASSKADDDVIKIIDSVYNMILDRMDPDEFTFGTILKACSNLMWGDAAAIFDRACWSGHVSPGVLSQFRQAVSAEVFRGKLFGKEQVQWSDLPAKWRRNVREDRPRRRKGS